MRIIRQSIPFYISVSWGCGSVIRNNTNSLGLFFVCGGGRNKNDAHTASAFIFDPLALPCCVFVCLICSLSLYQHTNIIASFDAVRIDMQIGFDAFEFVVYL